MTAQAECTPSTCVGKRTNALTEVRVARVTPFRFGGPEQEKRQKPCAVPLDPDRSSSTDEVKVQTEVAFPRLGASLAVIVHLLLTRLTSLARPPTDESSLSRTRCLGDHCQEMRWRAGRRFVEPLVPGGQCFGHRCARLLQSRQVLVHLFQQALAGSTDRLARRTTTVAGFQETCELLRGETESDRIAHDEQPRDGFIGVVPETAGRPWRARQDADAFVVANQIGTDTCATSRLADSERVAGHTPSYNLEPFQIQRRTCA